MSHLLMSPFLRKVLVADAVISAAAGAVMLAGAGPLASLLSLPRTLLWPAGAALVAYAAVLAWLARRGQMPSAVVWSLAAINVVWAVDCVALAAGAWFAPNALGQAFLGVQVVTVLVLAELYVVGLRRAVRAMPGQSGRDPVRHHART